MELRLIRNSNDYCWLYGTITENEDYICDTLEFGSSVAIPDGIYRLQFGKCTETLQQVILVINAVGNVVAKFINDPTTMNFNIRLRKENSNICVGAKITEPLLVMNDFSLRIIKIKISQCISLNETVYLEVVTPVNIRSTLKQVDYISN